MKSYQLKEAMIRRWSKSMPINNKGCSDHWWLVIYLWTWYSQTLRFEHHRGFYAMLRSWGIWGFNPQQTVHVAEPHPWTPSHWRTASPNARIPICGKPVVSTTGEIWNAGKHGIIYIWFYMYNYMEFGFLYESVLSFLKFLEPWWVDDREVICQPWNCLMGEPQNQWWWSVQHQFLWLWWGLNISERG